LDTASDWRRALARSCAHWHWMGPLQFPLMALACPGSRRSTRNGAKAGAGRQALTTPEGLGSGRIYWLPGRIQDMKGLDRFAVWSHALKLSTRAELKARKQAYVQDEILAAAAKLFAERGYRAVTIDDIGASLDYTKSVVYYYFTSKNEILWQIFQRIYDSYF